MSTYNKFMNKNIAPLEATKIGVYNSSGTKVGVVELGNLQKNNLGQKLYSFGAISDIHINMYDSQSDLRKALTYFTDAQVDFVCCAGDIAHNGNTSEWQIYKNILNEKSLTVYECAGNHDAMNSDVATNMQTYTNHSLYYSILRGNDLFVFVGLNANANGQLFTQAELQWLYETLENNRDKRIFLFEHVRPDDACGNYNNAYTYDIWGGTEQVVFESLLRHYKNIIFFHGHSHMKFDLQDATWQNANIGYDFECHGVHIPSITVPRNATATAVTAGSEGYVVDVYQNHIILKGRDFVNDKFLPIATYCLDTTLQQVEEGTYIDSTGTINTTGQIACTSINLNNTSLNFTDETTQTLVATVTPSDTTDTVNWSVEPSGVVSVVNGVVTPIASGSATITATCGTKTASCSVNVNLPSPYIYGFHYGRKIDSSTGVETDGSSEYSCSDFIEVDVSKTLYATVTRITDSGARKSLGKFAFYDENKNYLTYTGSNSNYQLGWSGTTFKDTTSNFNPPATTKYIKIRLYCTYGQVSASDFIANTRIVEDGVELGSDRVSE